MAAYARNIDRIATRTKNLRTASDEPRCPAYIGASTRPCAAGGGVSNIKEAAEKCGFGQNPDNEVTRTRICRLLRTSLADGYVRRLPALKACPTGQAGKKNKKAAKTAAQTRIHEYSHKGLLIRVPLRTSLAVRLHKGVETPMSRLRRHIKQQRSRRKCGFDMNPRI